MEPQSWHLRKTQLEEDRRYQNLIDIHKLTQVWLNEIVPLEPGIENRSHRLERFIPPHLVQNLWLLEKLKLDQLSPNLSSMVDASGVTDFLNELEEMIWVVQLSVLTNAIAGSSEVEALINTLEQITWQEGKKHAEERWNTHSIPKNFNLSDVALTLFSSALQKERSFLIEKIHAHEVSLYWLTSPSSMSSLNHHASVDILCQLYHQFIRGFLYGIEKSLKIEILPSEIGAKKAWKITLLLPY